MECDSFDKLVGLTPWAVSGLEPGSERIQIHLRDDEGREFLALMYHDHECCETVVVDDVVGDLTDLIEHKIVRAEVATSHDLQPPQDADGSNTWTFYHIGTAKGTLTIRWHGSSNGYYSETAEFELLTRASSWQTPLNWRGRFF